MVTRKKLDSVGPLVALGWRPAGTLLAPSWLILPHRSPVWEDLTTSWGHLEVNVDYLRPSCADLGRSWNGLGAVLGPSSAL